MSDLYAGRQHEGLMRMWERGSMGNKSGALTAFQSVTHAPKPVRRPDSSR